MKWQWTILFSSVVASLPLLCASVAAASPSLGSPPGEHRALAVAHLAPTLANAASAAPIRRIGHVRPGFGGVLGGAIVSSSNWAGYDATGDDFESVQATWSQPYVQPDSSKDTDGCFWVGLDGDGGSQTVEQIGTEGYSQDGSVSYDAWYEMYPADSVQIEMTISPGDLMTGTVTANGGGDFTLTLTDDTTDVSYTTQQYSDAAQDESAEIVAEAPTDGTTGDLVPLASFGTVDFTDCAFNGQPISDFDWNQIDMADTNSGATLASTTDLSAYGASFSVAYGDVAPAPMALTTTASGADSNWHRSPVTVTFASTDSGGPGVDYTDYAIGSGGWTEGTSVTLSAPTNHSNDGTHTIRYSAIDSDGNVEPIQTCQVKIDTLGPVCAARNATVKRGKSCRLYFKVHDALSPKVTTVLTITAKSGRVEKHWSWGYGENSAGWWWIPYTCHLTKGTYYIHVSGEDLAGNAQSVTGRARLRVT